MIKNKLGSQNRFSRTIILYTFLLVSVIFLFSGCTNNRYYKKNWHRTPTSTSRSRCGCLYVPKEKPVFIKYFSFYYAHPA